MKFIAAMAVLALAGVASVGAASPNSSRNQKPGTASCLPGVVGGKRVCLAVGQRCKTRYQGRYRQYGFVCVNGRLRKRPAPKPPVVTQPTPTPPAPTPAAIDGHFKGVTSQNETFEFDIVNGGLTFKGLKTGQINQGCTPPGHIYGNYFNWPDYTVPVSMAGDWTIDGDLTGGYVGSWPAATHLTIHGHMSGQTGTGNLELRRSFTNGSTGIAYTCDSGLVTWTVTRTS